MITLIYGSTSTRPLSHDELIEILDKARKNNAVLNLTGMLLYHDRNFIQVLEGEEETVVSLFEKIKKDPRHRGVLIFVKKPIEKRQLGEWEMGFVDVERIGAENIAGYSNFLDDPDHMRKLEDASYAFTFLNVFRQNVR